ncbi:hypothetical protein GGR55DRAFT_678000 [Xylaria sp. FL0064]|nr:hypothetical protein GGR55DRAFT_678000 [Xylaria sp. FL0064]
MASEANVENPKTGAEGSTSEAPEDVPMISPETIAARLAEVRSLDTTYDENHMKNVHGNMRKEIDKRNEYEAMRMALGYACIKAYVTGCYDGMIHAHIGLDERFGSQNVAILITFKPPQALTPIAFGGRAPGSLRPTLLYGLLPTVISTPLKIKEKVARKILRGMLEVYGDLVVPATISFLDDSAGRKPPPLLLTYALGIQSYTNFLRTSNPAARRVIDHVKFLDSATQTQNADD